MSLTEEEIFKIRWWQIRALKEKYPNDQEFGAKVRELINKTNYK